MNVIAIKNHRKNIPLWKRLLTDSVTDVDHLADRFAFDTNALKPVAERYPMQINPYFLSLIQDAADPLGKQVLPDPQEIEDVDGVDDPLDETRQSPVPGLIHRYPDRVVLLASNRCAVLCRFCMRKRLIESPPLINNATIDAGIDYIHTHPAVREVIVSGGDPLLRDDDALHALLGRLRVIPHVAIIRVHTRVPGTLPQRVTPELASLLKAFQPLYVNTHFNHPHEITPQSIAACRRLVDAGIPLGCQTVLLKGINDDVETIQHLVYKLLTARVKPYYLHQADPVKGACHFRTPIDKGLRIMAALRGNCSGMALPQYMIDLPGGGGKVPLLSESIIAKHPDKWLIRNYTGQCFTYPIKGVYDEDATPDS